MLRINEDTEVFDEALDRRVWSLADTRLQWHKRLAEMRRKVPAEVESTFTASFDQFSAIDAAERAALADSIATSAGPKLADDGECALNWTNS